MKSTLLVYRSSSEGRFRRNSGKSSRDEDRQEAWGKGRKDRGKGRDDESQRGDRNVLLVV